MKTGLMKETRIRNFILMLIGFAFLAACFFFEGRLNAQTTTAYALSYEFGLIPRGFVGTVIYLIKSILGIDLYTYHRVYLFTGLVTAVYYVILFLFYYICLKRVKETNVRLAETLILFLSIFMFTEFLTWNNFGRLDEYLMIITLISLILIISEKWEFMLVPLCIVAGLIHIGFVFTNINVILIALIWKIFQKDERERKKYIIIFLLCFLSVSILFIYFELIQQPLSMEAYDTMVALAKSISEDGAGISDSLLDSEILKKDVFEDEWIWHRVNYVETPIFIVLFSPYIYIFVCFFKGLINRVEDKIQKFKYIFILIGAATIIPSLLLKVDYGRWMFCIITYYCFIVLTLIVLGDENIIKQCDITLSWLKRKIPCYWLLMVYPLVFMPFRDVFISDVTTNIMNFLIEILREIGLWS